MPNSRILCENLTIGYDKKILIENLNLTIEQGDYLVILGSNGCGKSSLIKTILGLNKQLSGSVHLENLKNKDIGYLSQQNDLQKDFPASVKEILMSGFLGKNGLAPLYHKGQKDKADYYIRLLNLTKYQNKSFRDLSGGLQQRTFFARALCATSRVIILDEPTTSLDPDASNLLYDTLRTLKEKGITVIMVSHDIPHALNDATKVLYIDKTIFYGEPSAFLKSYQKTHKEVA